MRGGPGSKVLCWALVTVLLLNGCAAAPVQATGGSGKPASRGPQPGSEAWGMLEEARRAEIDSALAQLWGVASEVREVGAVLEFTYWVESGALTLLSLRRHAWGSGGGSAVDRESFTRGLRKFLSAYTEGALGEMHLTLRREEGRWHADFKLAERYDFPLDAKAWPVQRVDVRAEVLEGLLTSGKEIRSRLWVPSGAQVRWQVEVELEDERVTGLETHPPRSLPGGTSVKAAPETVGTWVNVLVPFTQGLGSRKVRMEWEGSHIAGSGLSNWKLVAAEVLRPPPPAPDDMAVVLEYWAMHEQIQRQWREQTAESFKAMGLFTAEQLALFIVGGIAARGVGVLVEASAPMIARVLARGGTYAVGWFRSLLARAAPAEKQVLRRLMAKAETQGWEALATAERQELQALLGRLDGLTTAKLSREAKEELREQARTLFFEKFRPDLAPLLRNKGIVYDIHHRIPLEHAHLFPLRDINAEINLAAAAKPVHVKVNNIWARLRNAPRAPTADEVARVEEIVSRHLGRWFNRVYDESSSTTQELAAAELSALQEVTALISQMR
jgi:hypothetical protein